ncbi:MFS transporter [Isoptericola hypogeus]|uniref:MFS transporter n=2 Tax=Isoptericola hypogeus TaxID=300179 RepID=A0ABP4VWS2_9MICO
MTPLHRRIWLVAALGLMLDGFDFFLIGVCLPLITADLDPSPIETGLIASSAVVGSVVGSLAGGPLADRIGRRRVFQADLALFVVAALACALAWGVWPLIVFRFVLGIAIGADYPLSSSYAAEIAPGRLRRRLLVGVISFQAVGSLLGVLTGLVILRLDPSAGSWRWILGSGALLAVVVVVARIGVPESPRWLAARGRREEAAAVVSRLVRQPVLPAQVEVSDAEPVPWRALFGTGLRRLTTLTSVPWFLLDVVVYGVGVFTPTVLAGAAVEDSGGFVDEAITSLRQTAVTNVFLVLGFAAAIVVINRAGVVRLQSAGFALVSVGLTLLALSAGLPGDSGAYYWLAFAGFALTNFFQNLGPNSTTFVLPAMVFPTEVRASGAGFGAAAGKAGAVLVTLCFPVLQEVWGLAVTVGVMAGGAMLAAVVTVLARPAPTPGRDQSSP